ncbi:MAG TPA: DMT family transporter [Vicinamibacterales bacterium]|nr:DMT family transporter [Vicinamibacterales bacterium]
MTDRRLSTIALTAMAMVAFAANSVLCRMALREAAIDPATFSVVRFLSGAVMLVIVAARWQRLPAITAGSWKAAFVLAFYALPFAFSYTQLSAGTGALILFGCVQVVMIVAALGSGERPHVLQWAGLGLALAGLVTLVFPGLTAPSPVAAALMTTAGVSWGLYTLLGRAASNPLMETTGNFVRAVPLIALTALAVPQRIDVEPRGLALAVTSGVVATGLGYVVWYAALRGLSAMRASVVQLAVPLLAAIGGVLLLTETITARLVVSTVLVLGGIAMAIAGGSGAAEAGRYDG